MANLFTVLFFAAVLGVAIAAIWSVVDENLELVLANMPWKSRQAAATREIIVRKSAYWATPSISSETPSLAMTVSPAMVR